MQISRHWRQRNWLLRLSKKPVTYLTEKEHRALVLANEERVKCLREEQERLKIADKQTDSIDTTNEEVVVAVA